MIARVHDDGDDGNDKASVSFWLNGSNRAVRHHKHAHNSNYTPLLSMCVCACLFSAPFIPACHRTTPVLLILPYIWVSHYSLCTALVRCGPDLSSSHKDASLLHLASPLNFVFFLRRHIASQLQITSHYLWARQRVQCLFGSSAIMNIQRLAIFSMPGKRCLCCYIHSQLFL